MLSLGIHRAQIRLVRGRDPARPPQASGAVLQPADGVVVSKKPTGTAGGFSSRPLPLFPPYSLSPSPLFSFSVVFRGVFIVVPGGKCLSTHLGSRRDSTLVAWLCLVFLSLRRDFQNHQSRRTTLPAIPGPRPTLCSRENVHERGRSRPRPRGAAVPHPSHRGRPGARVSRALRRPRLC